MKHEDLLSGIVRSTPPSGIRRFFDLANEMKGSVISLSIGEPDFVTPWQIVDAGIHSLKNGETHYSSNQGILALRESICRYSERKYGLHYDPRDETVVTVGGSEAIDLAIRALVNPGDEVIVPQPSFVSYEACVRLAGGVPVIIDCRREDDFKLRVEQLEAAVGPKTKMIIMGYPNNPTGAVMTRDDLLPLVRFFEQHDLVVVSDELYAELTYAPAVHCSIASFPSMRDRTIVIGGFSKAFAMTGWRIGYAVGPAVWLMAMNKIHQYAIMCAPTTAQHAAIEALDNCDEPVLQMAAEYDRRRRIVLDGVQKAGLDCFEPLGAFYVFPDITPSGLDSATFCERFLYDEKVAIVPGSAFGAAGEGYVRISYAASMENIMTAMSRLAAFMKRRQA